MSVRVWSNVGESQYRKDGSIVIIQLRDANIRAEYKITLSEHIVDTWERCMRKNPTLIKKYWCSCGFTESVCVLQPDSAKILRSNFQGLEKLLDVHRRLYKVKCPKCSESCTVDYVYNGLVFVQLSCTKSLGLPKKCPLSQIQKELVFKDRHRLTSVVVQNPDGVYIVFYRRMDGTWILQSKLFQPFQEYPESTIVQPHGALYVLLEEPT
ncbi:uncharacterized protein [Fopius arisanus]|nr:PREDICTED: uncharacterized protein LOC105272001 isoform X1 [Fopius arisanus]